ncbi:hypothetical protein P9618_26995, partial [Bacillus pseudomycoides]|uniref:hypothetical protein n=1 Tax=Bacillus pseudomycoides TaxID=64104 RepID=UPI002E1BD601|nr:hypothetical protein [Bacillus pseudomycoides]
HKTHVKTFYGRQKSDFPKVEILFFYKGKRDFIVLPVDDECIMMNIFTKLKDSLLIPAHYVGIFS